MIFEVPLSRMKEIYDLVARGAITEPIVDCRGGESNNLRMRNKSDAMYVKILLSHPPTHT
jgi:hypothetical protein